MTLTPEQTEDFEQKMLQLSKFARSIGLKIHSSKTEKGHTRSTETAPEEIKISEVRNLSSGEDLVSGVCNCDITYIHALAS